MKNYKALIVDDDLDSLGAMYEYMGFIFGAVKKADSPLKAIEKYRSFLPDVVFVDIRMPKMDGFSLIKQLRNINKDSIFIIVSAYDEKENLFNAIELNVLDYLKKPITSDDTQRVLKKISKKLNKVSQFIDLPEGYRWDNDNKVLTKDGRAVLLSTTKTKVFDYLINHKDKIVDGLELFEIAWKDKEYNPKSIRSVISKLRKKLPYFIHIRNVYGGKYFLTIQTEAIELNEVVKEHTRFARYISIPTVAVDLNHKILYKNQAFEEYISDIPRESNICFYHLFGLDAPCDKCGLKCPSNDVVSSKKSMVITREIKKDNKTLLADILASPLLVKDEVVAMILNIHDVTKYKEYQTLAKLDSLTGLYNRFMLEDKIEEAIKRSDRLQTSFALLFIDLDDFKYINDTYGHEVGDLLLQNFAMRLKETIRKSDTIARYGGDEFIAIIDLLKDVDTIDKVVEQLLMVLNSDYNIGNKTLKISCSIGVSIYTPDSKKDKKSLIKSADTLMYKAKDSGKATFKVSANANIK